MFYQCEDIYTTLPNIETAKHDAPRKVLNKPVKELYHDYRLPWWKYRSNLISLLCPKKVLTAKKRYLIQFLCEYCVNIDEARKSIHRAWVTHNLPNLKDNSKTLISICPTEYHHRSCIDGECALCGVHYLRERLLVKHWNNLPSIGKRNLQT